MSVAGRPSLREAKSNIHWGLRLKTLMLKAWLWHCTSWEILKYTSCWRPSSLSDTVLHQGLIFICLRDWKSYSTLKSPHDHQEKKKCKSFAEKTLTLKAWLWSLLLVVRAGVQENEQKFTRILILVGINYWTFQFLLRRINYSLRREVTVYRSYSRGKNIYIWANMTH
jgi:hypothetical protein